MITYPSMHFPRTPTGIIVFGPRTGSKTDAFQIPVTLPPGANLQTVLPIKVVRAESRRPGHTERVTWKWGEARCA